MVFGFAGALRNGLGRNASEDRLDDRVVVITGAARGIGAAVARQLVDAGARVALLDRDGVAADALAGELGSRATAFEVDVRSEESMAAACAAVATQFGGIDVVIANAGVAGPVATVATVDTAAWRQVIDINLIGAFTTIHVALPYLRQRRGYVLAIASVAAALPGPTVSAYMVSKSGVESLVRSLRIELHRHGVAAGIAYFGLVDTDLAGDLLSGLGAVMAALPGALGKPIPVEVAAQAITRGVAHRSRRVYAPRWVAACLDLRPAVSLADRVLAASPRLREVIRDADIEQSPHR